MMTWHTASLEDLDFIQQCATNNNLTANNYSAVNSILYSKKFDSHIAIDGDWFFEKYKVDGKTFFTFPHNVKGDKSDVASVLEKLAAEAAGLGCGFAIRNMTEDEKELLLKQFSGAEIKEEPGLSDYIYLTEKLASLSGKKLSRKRNHIHQFSRKYPDFRYEPLSGANIEAVRLVESKWLAENIPNRDLLIEQEIINHALDNFVFFAQKAGLTGGVLFVGDEPAAFCIASALSPQLTDVHFEKCISPFATDGGYAVINNEFAKTVGTQYINREEDLGLEGLRKAKLSYYPEIVLGKFTARILRRQP